MPPLRIGLIGCGRIAQSVHLGVLTGLPGVELVALAEPDPALREAAGRRAPRAVAFESDRELLEHADVEAVVICAPNALHAPAAVAALRRGRHVYLEKPLATTVEEARAVIAAWRESGVVGMVGFNGRFHALYQAVRRQLRTGRIGEVVGARSIMSTAVRPLPAWKRTRRSGGGVLLDLASHHVDLVRFLFGEEVREVSAMVRSQRCEDDSAILSLRLASGILVESFFSMSAVEEDCFEIYGQAGTLRVDRHRSMDVEITDPHLDLSRRARLWQAARSFLGSPYLLERIRAPYREPSYRAALAAFVAAARSGTSPGPSLLDGYRSLAVVEAAAESARSGRVVSLAACDGDPAPDGR